MDFMTPYRHDRERSGSFATINTEESLTQQSDARETDINFIVAQYHKTGQIPKQTAEPLYGDFSDGMDYREALDKINAAKDAFQEIPAAIRKRFDNDPAQFIDFATNPENIDELRKMGLASPEPEALKSSVQPKEQYDDEGTSHRTTDRQQPGGTRAEPREGENPVRVRQELREDGDREPRRSGQSGRSSQGPDRRP